MTDVPIDPYECPECIFARRVLRLCVPHQIRLGIRQSHHPSAVDALLRPVQPSEPPRVLDFVCAPEQGEPRPRSAPPEEPRPRPLRAPSTKVKLTGIEG